MRTWSVLAVLVLGSAGCNDGDGDDGASPGVSCGDTRCGPGQVCCIDCNGTGLCGAPGLTCPPGVSCVQDPDSDGGAGLMCGRMTCSSGDVCCIDCDGQGACVAPGTPCVGAACGGSDGGQDVDEGDGGAAGPCPAVAPADGAACTGDLGCSYGDHPNLNCRVRAFCARVSWSVTVPAAACAEPLLPPGCPSSPPTTGACSVASGCYYPDGTNCGCGGCCSVPGCVPCGAEPEGTDVWFCSEPPTLSPGCPATAANDGTPCALPDETYCQRESCGTSIVCRDGIWRFIAENACPAG